MLLDLITWFCFFGFFFFEKENLCRNKNSSIKFQILN